MSLARFRPNPGESDGGYVAVMTAILLPVLIGLCALAVDVSAWYLSINKQQKAADAAALAGAIYLPAKLDQAKAVAASVATRNGFTNGVNGATVTVSLGERPTQLRVSIKQELTNTFGGVIGLGKSAFTRDAVSDFSGPLALGSPCNVLGNEDMEEDVSGALEVSSPACTENAQYWANMAGGSVNKARGDATGSYWCKKPDSGQTAIDGCQTSTGALAASGTFPSVCNGEAGLALGCATSSTQRPQGYLYAVHVGTSAPSSMRIQLYDAAAVTTGDKCTDNLAGVAGTTNYYVTTDAESKARYSAKTPDEGNRFCTGDSTNTGDEGDGSTTTTKYTLYRPSPSASDPLAGGALCSTTVPGFSTTEFATKSLKDRLGVAGASNELAKYFHRWADLCDGVSIGSPVADGDYVVQVQTYGPGGAPGGGGQNRFAIRAFAGNGTNAAANGALNVAALQRESLYYNFKPVGGKAKFNLVRLPTGSGDHILSIRLFDIGDGTAVKVTFRPPDNSTLGGSAWSGNVCTSEPASASSPIPRGTLSGCTVSATLAKNGGRWQVIKVPLDEFYACNENADASKCWVTAELEATTLSDTTTWEASLEGDPVRLVPDP